MLKTILLFLLISFSVCIPQTFMNVYNKDGTAISFDIQEIQKLTFSDVTNIEDAKMLGTAIKSFTLLQNYPNPFNPTTSIQYSIPKSGNVQVRVFNINGQQIRTITDQFQESGIHQAKWDSKNDTGQRVSSGVYIYQIKFNNAFLSKKLMLIK